jgi:O-antigen/teichoic acid export membrane protein
MVDKRVIKNAAFLYLRMLLLILITLFTTKLLLKYLGIIDFGIYSLVWGVVLILGFFNNSITNSVQRFLNINLANKNNKKLIEIYSVSIVVFLVLGLFLALILIAFKDLFFFKFLNIPNDRVSIVNHIYYLMVGSFFINFLSLNFHSCLISMEKFSFYAFITVFEGVLKLFSVFLLYYFPNKLYHYSLFLLISSIIIFIVLFLYCKFKISFCRFSLVKNLYSYKEILGFISWNVFGSFGVVISAQGIPLVANIFYGVIINGSLSVASQLNALIGTVTSNFQKAFSPYLMKNFVSNDNVDTKIFNLTKLSILFYSMAALPLIFYIHDLLLLWLNKIPLYVEGIVKISAIISLFEVLAGPLWMLIQAEGNIRRYQLCVFFVMIFSIPIAYTLLYLNFNIYNVWFMLLCMNCILLFLRIYFVNKIIGSNFFVNYFKTVLIPTFIFLGMGALLFFGITTLNMNQNLLILIILNAFGVFFLVVLAYFLLLDKHQKENVYQLMKKIEDKVKGKIL